MTVNDIIESLTDVVCPDLAEEWDNIGLLVGDVNALVSRVIIALDCTRETIEQALDKKAELIITHHPLIFRPIDRVTNQTPTVAILLSLIKNNIALYTAHTNLDNAEGGTNDVLFKVLDLKDKTVIPGGFLCRVGTPSKTYTLMEFTRFVAEKLSSGGVSFVGDGHAPVKKIGLCAGSGGKQEYMDLVKSNGCDTYLSGDISYHQARYAEGIALNVISAPHFSTEAPVAEALRGYLEKKITDVCFYTQENQRDVFNY